MSADNGEEPPARQTVADPEEFNQQRRLASIHDARDRARVAYEKTQDESEEYQNAISVYRAAVENYVGELEGLARRYQFGDQEADLWESKVIDTVTVPIPREVHAWKNNDDIALIDPIPDPKTFRIVGLKGYLEITTPFATAYQIDVRQKHRGYDTKTARINMPMPVKTSYEAFRTANQFLAMAGIDIELQDDKLGEEKIIPDY